MKFESEYFDNAEDLVQAKDEAYSGVEQRRKRLRIIRRFSNGLSALTKKEAQKIGRKEIVNHLTTYSKLVRQHTKFKSMVTGTNAVCEIIVDTDEPEQDLVTSARMTEAVNRGAFHHKGKFANFWGKVSGEIVIAGGVPVTHPARFGWCPRLAMDMFFPKETELDSDEMTYSFEPREFSVTDLKELLASITGKKGRIHDKQAILTLLLTLNKQIKDGMKESPGFDQEITRGVRDADEGLNNATIPGWSYFEVKFRKDGSRYVSETIFTDGISTHPGGEVTGKKDLSSAAILSHNEFAYQNAFEWLKMVSVDAEIGGVKNTDTQRGVAELLYPSGSEMEELLNVLIEGDKARAKPKFVPETGSDPEDIAAWNIQEDTFAPENIRELDLRSNAQHLVTPMSMLDQNASSLTGSPVSNSGRGGELRTQSIERQQDNTDVQGERINQAGNDLDSILETSVWRLLAAPVKPGTDGYFEALWVREYLRGYGINFKALAERKHGRFRWIRVRAKRNVGNGDRQQQIETADWLMSHRGEYEPASRPLVVKTATLLRTQDPDLAELLVKTPQVIMNQQRVIAENEFDTIMRRAAAGMAIPVAPDDIHPLHIPTHMLDAQSLLARHNLRPWGMDDVVGFASLLEHTGGHLQILIGSPQTNAEGREFLEDFQRLVAASAPIVKEVQEAANEEGQLSAKERADLELNVARMQLDAEELGVKRVELDRLHRVREARSLLSQRAQLVKEINEDRRIRLSEEELDVKKKQQQTPA